MLHGHVGLAQQGGNLPRVVRQQADADGGTDHQLLIADHDRQTQLAQHPAGQSGQARQAAVGVQQHGKLITGQPRQGLGLGNGLR